jgi:hypothetical protein
VSYELYESPPGEPWYSLAMVALEQTVVGNSAVVAATLQEILETFGWEGVNRSLQIWADMCLEAHGIPEDTQGRPIVLGFYDNAGTVLGADDVEPHAAWCGRMLAARAADDADQWVALCVTAGDRFMEYCMAMLHGAARMVAAYMLQRDR